MLSTYGIIKVTNVQPLRTFGKSFILNFQFLTKERTWNGEDRFDTYEGSMYFTDKEAANMWAEQVYTDRVIELKWASIEGGRGDQPAGRTRVRVYPDIRFTIPK